MNVLEEHSQLLQDKITNMPKGMEAGLVKLFGDEWNAIGTSGQKKEFGRLFKAAVAANSYPNIEWVRIENSGRFDVYRKL